MGKYIEVKDLGNGVFTYTTKHHVEGCYTNKTEMSPECLAELRDEHGIFTAPCGSVPVRVYKRFGVPFFQIGYCAVTYTRNGGEVDNVFGFREDDIDVFDVNWIAPLIQTLQEAQEYVKDKKTFGR